MKDAWNKAFTIHAGVTFRACLYFFAIFLGSIGDKLSPVFFQDQWPSLPYTVGSFIVALGLGLMALRAFFDGSAQRHSDELKLSSDTQHFQNPQTKQNA